MIPADMVRSEIVPMLMKEGCGFVMLGTPFGLDHPFKKEFDSPLFNRYHEPSQTSPLVSQAQLQEWKELMTREEWEREIEAKWVEPAYTFFPNDLLLECVDPGLQVYSGPEGLDEEKLRGRRFYFGLDLGKKQDHSGLVGVERVAGRLRVVFMHKFPLDTPWSAVIGYVTEACTIFRPGKICVDETGIGEPILEQLTRAGVRACEGVKLNDSRKQELLGLLKLSLEQTRLALPDDRELLSELNEQRYEYRTTGGAPGSCLRFWHPEGSHDDLLFALALAVRAANSDRRPSFMPITRSF
jgi:hypothetical protein